jgi:enoyl-CoA hydratase
MTITRTVDDGLATLTMDDGKVNAFDLTFFSELESALDDCAEDGAVVIVGRPGMFSAGLNTKVLADISPEEFADLLSTFGRTMLRVWLEPRPVVAAVTGHAIAGGTILAMACDHAVAADGDFRWGLTETTIGFAMPQWILAIARGNVRNDRLDDLVLPGALVSPAEAVDVGYADALAPADQVLTVATARARELSQLPAAAYRATKDQIRGQAARTALEGMEADMRALLGGLT